MIKRLLSLGLILAVAAPAPAWFDKGHMVVAQLAWKKLNDRQRSQIISVLKKHPHYEEFLTAKRPDGISEDEWVFLRAATWADWVGAHHSEEFGHGPWHYINLPFVPPGSHIDAGNYQPKGGEENILRALCCSIRKIETGTDTEKAIYLCWLLHLVGDIHQPLHCTQLVSEQFPMGDQGGNLALIRTRCEKEPIKLHIFWDSLMGTTLTAEAIAQTTREVESVLKDKAATIGPEVEKNTTFDSWALESFELARKAVYLNGELKLGRVNGEGHATEAPEAPADYDANAKQAAKMQVAKAGVRLAGQLAKLFPG
jgi:hypothetical protein